MNHFCYLIKQAWASLKGQPGFVGAVVSTMDGIIVADTLQNISYIKRPAGAKSNTNVSLYRLLSQESATSQELRFGAQAGQFIQILSGASVGEQFIISDLSNLQTTSQTLNIN